MLMRVTMWYNNRRDVLRQKCSFAGCVLECSISCSKVGGVLVGLRCRGNAPVYRVELACGDWFSRSGVGFWKRERRAGCFCATWLLICLVVFLIALSLVMWSGELIGSGSSTFFQLLQSQIMKPDCAGTPALVAKIQGFSAHSCKIKDEFLRLSNALLVGIFSIIPYAEAFVIRC